MMDRRPSRTLPAALAATESGRNKAESGCSKTPRKASEAPPTQSAIALCATCGTPMRVTFGGDGEIKEVFAVCKCPRESVASEDASR